MNCEDCPVRDKCGGDLVALSERLHEQHGAFLTLMVLMGQAMGTPLRAIVWSVFLHGYMAAAVDSESVQLDMDVWGECFGAESQT